MDELQKLNMEEATDVSSEDGMHTDELDVLTDNDGVVTSVESIAHEPDSSRKRRKVELAKCLHPFVQEISMTAAKDRNLTQVTLAYAEPRIRALIQESGPQELTELKQELQELLPESNLNDEPGVEDFVFYVNQALCRGPFHQHMQVIAKLLGHMVRSQNTHGPLEAVLSYCD